MVLSKTPNCYCLTRAGRSHHTKKSGHWRKFQKRPQLFWRCPCLLLTSNLGTRCPMLSSGISVALSYSPPSPLSAATWVVSQKQRRYLCPLPLEWNLPLNCRFPKPHRISHPTR